MDMQIKTKRFHSTPSTLAETKSLLVHVGVEVRLESHVCWRRLHRRSLFRKDGAWSVAASSHPIPRFPLSCPGCYWPPGARRQLTPGGWLQSSDLCCLQTFMCLCMCACIACALHTHVCTYMYMVACR